MTLYVPLELSPRPDMQRQPEAYLVAVQRSAAELREAQPWLLIQYPGDSGWLVARRRTWLMLLATAVVNVWRRPRRWWLGRLRLAYFATDKARAGKAMR